MMYGICLLSVIPMRSEASDQSEMVNQVLYGETFDILQQEEKWSKIRLHHDSYEGWIDHKQYQTTDKKADYKNIVNKLFVNKNKQILPLGALTGFEVMPNPNTIADTAKLFLNTPYLWGGRTCLGIDCSGFTQMVFRAHRIFIPRDAYQQAEVGKIIQLADAQSHDLAFFANANGKIIHVGIILKNSKNTRIIHASGKVRIDILDPKGIFNEETGNYTHILYSVKRMVGN
jgi:cell wall-associated NlpC family hydrolase